MDFVLTFVKVNLLAVMMLNSVYFRIKPQLKNKQTICDFNKAKIFTRALDLHVFRKSFLELAANRL